MKKNKVRNWNYNLVIREIKKNGYYIYENFFSPNDLKEIKNSLLDTLHYIKKDNEKDLAKKYYKIKKYSKKLKGNWYDMANYNLTLFKHLHSEDILKLIKKFYRSKVIFSARPCIHAHDSSNDYLLEPHQETNMFSRDGILLWSPLFDTNKENGGLVVYKNSHKYGFFKHKLKSSSGKKTWTKNFTNIDPNIFNKFEKVELNVKAGSAVFMINSMVHGGYPMTKKNRVRITITERYNPLQKIPFLKKEKAPLNIPYKADYNKILE